MLSSEDRPLRLGVVGVGQRSEIATCLADPEFGAAVVACADPVPAAVDRARARFGAGVTVVRDHRELIGAGLDGIFVTSPDDTHEQIAVDLLRAGIPLFVEKPLAITTEGADRILRTAAECATAVFVGHNMRHMPVVTAMRDLVLAGAIGEVQAVWCRHFVGNGGDYYFRDWHADRARTTGLLLQKGAHDIDVIHWLAGSRTTRVTAMGRLAVYGRVADRRQAGVDPGMMEDWFDQAHWPPLSQTDLNPVVDVEDLSMMLMQLESGALASYEQCHFTPDYWRNYTVIGDAGRLENFGDTEGAVVRVWNRRSGYRADADHTVAVPSGARHGGADPLLVLEFLDILRGRSRAGVSSPVAARDAVAAGCAATRSLREGSRPIDVPPLDAGVARAVNALTSAADR
jgi:predicted dehydrogenase